LWFGSSGGIIDFGNGITLSRSGSNLRISNSNIVTEASGDSRYLLRGGIGNFLFGSGAVATGSNTIVLGANAYTTANNLGAIAIGHGAHSAGNYTTALGEGSYATQLGSTALGNGAQATGIYSIALGQSSSSATQSVSMGYLALADANDAVAIGSGNHASAVGATAFGSQNQAIGAASFTAGTGNLADNWGSLASGTLTQSKGYLSSTFGIGTIADGPMQVVIGAFNNLDTSAGYSTSFSRYEDEMLFVIGNGHQSLDANNVGFTETGGVHHVWNFSQTDVQAGITRSNAFVVRWNGKTEAAGNIESKATTGYNKFKAPILVAPSGDISMGEFTAGEQP
jgi:hypothetical protein